MKPNWMRGNNTGEARNIYFVVAIQKKDRTVYDVVLCQYTQHTKTYKWVDFNAHESPIIGFIALTDILEWCTGSGDYPHLSDSNTRVFLPWAKGETSDKSQRYNCFYPLPV